MTFKAFWKAKLVIICFCFIIPTLNWDWLMSVNIHPSFEEKIGSDSIPLKCVKVFD
jgi:hypothetical protein